MSAGAEPADRGGPAARPDWASRPRVAIDRPGDGDVALGAVTVDGWAVLEDGPPVRIELAVDGRIIARARPSLARPDVAGIYGDPSAMISGFACELDVGALAGLGEELSITAVATGMDGAQVLSPPRRWRTVAASAAGPSDEERARGHSLRRRGSERLPGPPAPAHGGRVRLLVVTHDLARGGAQLYLQEVLRYLAASDRVECSVITSSPGELGTELEEWGIEVHTCGPLPLDSVDAYESRLNELTLWAGAFAPDVVLTNTVEMMAGGEVAARLNVANLWAVHESWPLEEYWRAGFPPGAVHPYVHERTCSLLGQAQAVLFVANATRELYLPHVAPRRALTLRYGIDLTHPARELRRVPEARRALGLDPERRLVLCLASVEPRKAQASLCQAFAALADRHGDVDLAVVGMRSSEYEDALRAYVSGIGLGSRIRLVEMTSQTSLWLAAGDLLVCASDVESMPRSVLEAMGAGTPVLATSVFGLPEVIEDGRTGFLCEARDVGALSGALDHVLSLSPGAMQRVAASARRRVEKHHDARHYVRAWERMVLDAAGRFEPRAWRHWVRPRRPAPEEAAAQQS